MVCCQLKYPPRNQAEKREREREIEYREKLENKKIYIDICKKKLAKGKRERVVTVAPSFCLLSLPDYPQVSIPSSIGFTCSAKNGKQMIMASNDSVAHSILGSIIPSLWL